VQHSGVTQRVFGWPNGECVRASYATILGLPIEAIPRLDPGAAALVGQEQAERERAWLASIGLGLYEIASPPDKELPREMLYSVPQVPHLMSGVSPRGYGHRCVGVGGRVAFDPHPSRAGLTTVYAIGFLVPLCK
jgi:hypothetical protein